MIITTRIVNRVIGFNFKPFKHLFERIITKVDIIKRHITDSEDRYSPETFVEQD